MVEVPNKTIRDKAVEALVEKLETMEAGEPSVDPYTVTWSVVERTDPEQFAHGKIAVLGVIEGEERVLRQLTGDLVDEALQITLLFRIIVDDPVDVASDLSRVLGELQRRIGEDPSLGGAVIDTRKTGSSFDIEGVQDKQAEGALFLELHYRSNERDPRKAA